MKEFELRQPWRLLETCERLYRMPKPAARVHEAVCSKIWGNGTAHIPSNGSVRVRQCRSCGLSDGSGPASSEERFLIPAKASISRTRRGTSDLSNGTRSSLHRGNRTEAPTPVESRRREKRSSGLANGSDPISSPSSQGGLESGRPLSVRRNFPSSELGRSRTSQTDDRRLRRTLSGIPASIAGNDQCAKTRPTPYADAASRRIDAKGVVP